MPERMRRVNEALRQVLSEALPELKDPRIGFVTITGVETTPDLRQARVSRQLHLKRTPLLAFEYDPSVEQGVRMSQLIDELAPAPDGHPADDATDDDER